ncbi:Sec-independent protein translocase protein TatC [Frankliniella fusca]|uniref:Sec-independent protein translocase protein TatC n=1 Tax=Frankliniella fusca TaxID=407009 RepID=A0AAE1I2B6_9NEOP|nr:Sec-independent protein translocase protein TatC [Frankliniella fusca]
MLLRPKNRSLQVTKSSDNSSPADSTSETTSGSEYCPKKPKKTKLSSVVPALDRTKISQRSAAYILQTALFAVNETAGTSSSNIHRLRVKTRSEIAQQIRQEFHAPQWLTVHFDSKKMENLTGDGTSERLPVLVTGPDSTDQLLGVPALKSVSGEQQAVAVNKLLVQWGIQTQVKCVAGDTTSSVSGWKNGAIQHLEKKIGNDLLNDESIIEKLSCTDLEQVWGTLKEQSMSKFQPSPLHEFCHVKKPALPYKRTIKEVSEEMSKAFRDMFLADQPNSEAALFLSGVRAPPLRPPNALSEPQENATALQRLMMMAMQSPNFLVQRAAEIGASLLRACPAEQQKFYEENIMVTTQEAKSMNVDTIGQDKDLWFLFKSYRITGSICYPLYTYYNNKNPDWTNKLANTFSGDSHCKSQAMQDGIDYEDDGRDSYLKNNPSVKVVTTGIFVHPLVPWLGYSADGIVFENDSPVKLLEIKVPVKGNKFSPSTIKKELKYLDKSGHLKHKHPYYGQVQLGMALYNLSSCDFINYCICADDIVTDTVMFDEPFVLDLLERLTKLITCLKFKE